MALTTNLVSYWKLDGDATDSHGSNDGTNNGADLTATGKINQCGDFDGSDDYIDTNLGTSYAITDPGQGDFSVSCWLISNDVNHINYFIDSGGGDSSNRGMALYFSSNKFGTRLRYNNKKFAPSTFFSPSTGVWYH